jgi:hypothetical protein
MTGAFTPVSYIGGCIFESHRNGCFRSTSVLAEVVDRSYFSVVLPTSKIGLTLHGFAALNFHRLPRNSQVKKSLNVTWHYQSFEIETLALLNNDVFLDVYALWLLQEPHGVTSQKTPFFIVTAVKTSNLTLALWIYILNFSWITSFWFCEILNRCPQCALRLEY